MMAAVWKVFDDDEALCLQIELGKGFAVTLTVPKVGDPPGSPPDPPDASLWAGSGSRSFTRNLPIEHGETVETFRAWLDLAVMEQD
jgi:hypothetical protein